MPKPMNPRPLLNADQYRQWQRENLEVMDQLPDQVRACIKDIGLELDCGKVLRALQVGMSEADVCDYLQAAARKIRSGDQIGQLRSKMI